MKKSEHRAFIQTTCAYYLEHAHSQGRNSCLEQSADKIQVFAPIGLASFTFQSTPSYYVWAPAPLGTPYISKAERIDTGIHNQCIAANG